jgi:hypothetical protein
MKLPNVDLMDDLVNIAKNVDDILTQNTRKIILDILQNTIASNNPSTLNTVLALGKFFDNKNLKKIGAEKTR